MSHFDDKLFDSPEFWNVMEEFGIQRNSAYDKEVLKMLYLEKVKDSTPNHWSENPDSKSLDEVSDSENPLNKSWDFNASNFEAAIHHVCEITGKDETTVRHFLEMFEGNVELATNAIFESEEPDVNFKSATNNASTALESSSFVRPFQDISSASIDNQNEYSSSQYSFKPPPNRTSLYSSEYDTNDSRSDTSYSFIPSNDRMSLKPERDASINNKSKTRINSNVQPQERKFGRSVYDPNSFHFGASSYQADGSSLRFEFPTEEDFGEEDDGYDDYDEEVYNPSSPGVRRPDRVINQRLASPRNVRDGRNVRAEHMADMRRRDAPNVIWHSNPPYFLSNTWSFEEVKEVALSQRQWVIVNIQSHLVLSSNILNSDIWANENIKEIIKSNFCFWQRGHTSIDGQEIMSYYHLSEKDLPWIAIIDPKTGMKLYSHTGNIDINDFCALLLEYADDSHFGDPMWMLSKHNIGLDAAPSFHNSTPPILPPTPPCSSEAENITFLSDAGAMAVDEDVVLTRNDFGDVPDEPVDGSTDIAKVSVKLSSGKPIMRKFRKTDTVRNLFAWVRELLVPLNQQDMEFDLFAGFPPSSLKGQMSETIESAKISGSMITFRLM